MECYGLYQTLNNKIPKSDLKADQKIELTKFVDSCTSEQKEAVILLICEHARINDGYLYSNKGEINIPYGGKIEGSNLQFEWKKTPIHLRWILWKFTQIGKNDYDTSEED